ncbi:MAG TPA: hypothetical protein VH916_08485, partial [Dehalococcoidia bacterium]
MLRGAGHGRCAKAAQNRRNDATETASHAHSPMLGSPSGAIARCKPMPSRLITLLLVPLVALLAACGSEAGQPASASSDVSQLLRDTFSNLSKLKSADVGLQLRLDSPSAQGPVTAEVSGPFASTGEGKLPRFAFAATLSAAGRSERVGATWTGEKAFITLQNTSYAVSDLVARQFAAGYQQALRSNQSKQAKGGLLLSSLGIDFTKWLKNVRNAGTSQVGDARAVEITGQADIPRVVDDLARISQRAQALGGPGTSGGSARLTPQQKQQLEAAIKSVGVQIYTGAQDRILRRLVVHAVLHEPQAQSDSTLDLDLRFTAVNGDQQISAPANPKPFSELLK